MNALNGFQRDTQILQIIPARITKAGRDFAEMLDFKDISFLVKIREIYKIEKKNTIDIRVFGYENKEKYPSYVSKQCCEEKSGNNNRSTIIDKRRRKKALCADQTFQQIHI